MNCENNNQSDEQIKEDVDVERNEIPKIENLYLDIYNFITYNPISVEYLARKSNMKISEINQKLTMLELQGRIKSMPGNNYVRI